VQGSTLDLVCVTPYSIILSSYYFIFQEYSTKIQTCVHRFITVIPTRNYMGVEVVVCCCGSANNKRSKLQLRRGCGDSFYYTFCVRESRTTNISSWIEGPGTLFSSDCHGIEVVYTTCKPKIF
jgi:hypothetical protein